MPALSGLTPAVLFALLSLACWFDWRFRRIPNLLVAIFLCAALAMSALGLGTVSLGQSFLGALIGLLLLLPFYAVRAMGAGDVKLMSAIGALLGAPAVFWAVIYTGMAGGVMGMAVLVWLDGLKLAFEKLMLFVRFRQISFLRPGSLDAVESSAPVRLPYALAMSAGAALFVLFGPPI